MPGTTGTAGATDTPGTTGVSDTPGTTGTAGATATPGSPRATGTARAVPAPGAAGTVGAPGAAGAGPSAGDPFAPSTAAVRVFAGVGLVLLVFAFLATVLVMLRQAYVGDGASGPLGTFAMWSLGLSGLVGLWAMCLPHDAVGHRGRRGAVFVQYALMVCGPLLAAVDFA
ncbi:hypothetical protein GCM10010393_12340 [Streptomyces gobitricini]|uniref:Collagen-like protein n=1 Tax=Streptomyces gobitricini TaxID=68211 RepID=A0ABN3LFJ3_9ACTN